MTDLPVPNTPEAAYLYAILQELRALRALVQSQPKPARKRTRKEPADGVHV